MGGLKTLLHRHLLPQRNTGSLAWALHRLSGIALALYLLPHFITINNSRSGPNALDTALGWYAGPSIAVAEFVLIATVAFHAFNGMRIILVDFFNLSHAQKLLFWVVLAACAAVLVGASLFFVPRILAPG